MANTYNGKRNGQIKDIFIKTLKPANPLDAFVKVYFKNERDFSFDETKFNDDEVKLIKAYIKAKILRYPWLDYDQASAYVRKVTNRRVRNSNKKKLRNAIAKGDFDSVIFEDRVLANENDL